MGIPEHLTTFAGLPVREHDPERKRKESKPCAYRVGMVMDAEDEQTYAELLDRFLSEHGGPNLKALVIGAWESEEMTGASADSVVEPLVANRKRMPNLRALFFGDIIQEECEISWINHGDLSPILPAFPKLEEFRIRGVGDLTFGKLKHGNLRSFAVESGGLPEGLLQEIARAELPKLTHLELWLGTLRYGGIPNVDPLAPLLAGKRFKKLKYLGLRNADLADEVARVVVASPLLDRLQTLDLSLGSMTEIGAARLLGCAAIRKLKKLDLHHHFISRPFVSELKKLPIQVDVGEVQEPDFYDYGKSTHVWRFISASE